MRTEQIRLLAWKGLTDIERYGQPGPEGSLVKWLWSDTNQKLTQVAADVRRPRGADRRHPLELRAAARPRQLDRGRHDRGAQEHRRRARARPPAAEGGRVAMDFGLTDDQRDIQRTARELLGRAPRRSACASTPRPAAHDDALWKELVRARLARHRRRRGARRPGARHRRAGDPAARSSAARARPSRSCPRVLAATLIEHAGSDEQRARWLPGLASGELTGAASATRPSSSHGGAGADVIVLVSTAATARAGRAAPRPSRVASIDSDPAAPRAWTAPARRAAPRRRRGRRRPRARRRRGRARRRLRSARWR